ncbi:MAG: hypothetical protein NZ805_06720 [Armatimonadetes bacterium]|nr:hypothetical protein [Armatimonadota bacterium]MDW8026778.1 hypothetical protein [Armatimonadota bacterium]
MLPERGFFKAAQGSLKSAKAILPIQLPIVVNGIEVIALLTIPILFSGFLGQSFNTVQARAKAKVGNLRTLGIGNNVVPIAVYYEVFRDAQEGDNLSVWDGY